MRKSQLRMLMEERILNMRKEVNEEHVTDAEWEFCVNAELNLLSDEQVLDNYSDMMIIVNEME
jgi:hypothetical protein